MAWVLRPLLDEYIKMETKLLRDLMSEHNGNVSQVAWKLGIQRASLNKILKKRNINASDYRAEKLIRAEALRMKVRALMHKMRKCPNKKEREAIYQEVRRLQKKPHSGP